MKPNRFGNYGAFLGVYRSMVRGAVFLLVCSAGLGQVRQDDPLQAKLTAIYKARTEGRLTDAASMREEVRTMLEHLPADAPQFGGWVQSVAQLYADGGRTSQARAVWKAALERTGGSQRIQLLTSLAESWRQDRNLPKAAEYLEKAVAAQEVAPKDQPKPALGGQVMIISGLQARQGRFYRPSGPEANLNSLYQRLSELQQQLGHPELVAALNVKMRAVAAKGGDETLASYFEQQGQLGEAAAVFKGMAERSGNPLEAANALQSLANIYVRQENFADAAGAQQQAIARLEAAGSPDLRGQATAARQTLAQFLQQAGRTDQADAVYQDLVARSGADQQTQVLLNYAGYLSSTQRGAQAMVLLKAFETSHPTLQPWEETSLYYGLENAARVLGDTKKAEEYMATLHARQPPDVADQVALDALFQKAQSAAGAGRSAEAFDLAMQALDAAPWAQNREGIGWQVPSIASSLSTRKDSASAELLYQRAFSLAKRWSDDSIQPLLKLLENYARFLMSQRDRWGDVPGAIERYRSLLATAKGADSGMEEEALRMTIDFDRTRTPAPASILPAQDLVAYEEAINGSASEPYLRALESLAQTYRYNGDREHEIPVRKRIVQIADLVFPANHVQRGQVRIDVAMGLAAQGQFDEAEGMAAEAVKQVKGQGYDYAVLQIREMRASQLKPRQ